MIGLCYKRIAVGPLSLEFFVVSISGLRFPCVFFGGRVMAKRFLRAFCNTLFFSYTLF